jgi:oligosaccharide repeat unit polymerase
MNKTINPVYFYFILWIGVLCLFNLKFSYLLLDMDNKTLVYILCSSFLFVIPAIILPTYTYKYYNYHTKNIYLPRLKNTKTIFWFWILSVCLEIMSFGLFPIFGFLGFNTKIYTEWGFGGLHGLLNGILMAYTIINFGYYLKTKSKKYLMIFIICCLWPMMLVTRQMFMSIFIQSLFVYYYLVGFKKSVIVKVVLFSFLIIYGFGLLGDLRSSSFYDLAKPTKEYPDFLPSGFLWVYIYIVSPINNIIYNIDKYPIFRVSFFDAFGSLLPSPLRKFFLYTTQDINFKLVVSNLTVASCHKNFLAGFGIIGSLFYQMIISTIITIFYIKMKEKNNIKYIFITAILGHNIMLSFFVDAFTNLVFMSEIFFVYIFFLKIK